MKKIMPYIISLVLGTIFGYLVFDKTDFDIKEVFGDYEEVTGFQLGVFNDLKVAEEFKNKYTPSVIIKDDDVYRVYYSILKSDEPITKMEDYLSNKEISFYKKTITINDADLISAIHTYENGITKGNDKVIENINNLIMASYKESVL
ncbi:MAG: hypothetical protein Q4C33_01785 [bacterium]|nr:hypothetical protein [bacterium]